MIHSFTSLSIHPSAHTSSTLFFVFYICHNQLSTSPFSPIRSSLNHLLSVVSQLALLLNSSLFRPCLKYQFYYFPCRSVYSSSHPVIHSSITLISLILQDGFPWSPRQTCLSGASGINWLQCHDPALLCSSADAAGGRHSHHVQVGSTLIVDYANINRLTVTFFPQSCSLPSPLILLYVFHMLSLTHCLRLPVIPSLRPSWPGSS